MSKVFEALQKAERERGEAPSQVKDAAAAGGDAGNARAEAPVLPLMIQPERPGARRVSPMLVVHNQPDSPIVEQIKRIRTHLLHNARRPVPPRSVMVTSAIAGEGKSFIAANLAVSVAQGLNDSVLLVDCDVRNPTLHQYLGVPQGPGLSEYLNGEAELSAVVRPTDIPRLQCIPGGGRKKNPIELISSPRMADLIRAANETEDGPLTLLDATPTILTNEPAVLAKLVQGIVFVVRHDMTPRNAVKDSLTLLPKDKILGLILNDSQHLTSRIYGYAYKAYYGGEPYGGKPAKGKR
jgi:capsular exopolysaccharide synthesis family protein